MSYYILPKNINSINVNPKCGDNQCDVHISFSLLNYYNSLKNQIINMFFYIDDISSNNFDEAITIVNPCEFIFSKVPGSNFSVSKLKPKTNLFYELFEILNNLNLFDIFKDTTIKTLHMSPNYSDSVYCNEIFRENYIDEYIYHNDVNLYGLLDDNKFDYIFYECNKSNYFITLIISLIILLKNQKYNGICIIKIHHIFHKQVLDVLYFLTCLYDKVYIVKPNTSNITTFDKYIVCKNFKYNNSNNSYLRLNYYRLLIFLKKFNPSNNYISEILDVQIPYYFKTKIDDLNIIIGHQQLEALNQIINIFTNKNKEEKIESIKKLNIQKSVMWCEKYKIPCNKFSDKINMFLPIMNETISL
jgi:hypothetical protein